MGNGPINFDLDRLSTLHFNPLLSGCGQRLALSADIDPDSNSYFDQLNCRYFTESKFNEIMTDTRSSISTYSNCLSFLHLNIRSLTRNIDELEIFLSNFTNKFTVVGISETWLQTLEHNCDIKGYNFVHNYRKDKTGGGVGLYLDSTLEFKTRYDLVFNDSRIESLFVEICRPRTKNIIVGIVYRPPDQRVDEFIKCNEALMMKVSRENKVCYLMGDYNLNLLNYENHQFTSEFLDIMYSCMFVPLISRPTRITSNTATLIDNIFSNNLENHAFSGLFFTDISDHLPVFTVTLEEVERVNANSYYFVRDKNNSNIDKFHECLRNVVWSDIPEYNDPRYAYSVFLDKFTNIYNSCFPLKKITNSKNKPRKPWLSKGLLMSIKRKSKLYHRYVNNPSVPNEITYKRFKNKLNHLLRIAKREYYENQIKYAESNIKHTWKILNEVINRKKNQRSYPPILLSTTVIFPTPWRLLIIFVNILQILDQIYLTVSTSHPGVSIRILPQIWLTRCILIWSQTLR